MWMRGKRASAAGPSREHVRQGVGESAQKRMHPTERAERAPVDVSRTHWIQKQPVGIQIMLSACSTQANSLERKGFEEKDDRFIMRKIDCHWRLSDSHLD